MRFTLTFLSLMLTCAAATIQPGEGVANLPSPHMPLTSAVQMDDPATDSSVSTLPSSTAHHWTAGTPREIPLSRIPKQEDMPPGIDILENEVLAIGDCDYPSYCHLRVASGSSRELRGNDFIALLHNELNEAGDTLAHALLPARNLRLGSVWIDTPTKSRYIEYGSPDWSWEVASIVVGDVLAAAAGIVALLAWLLVKLYHTLDEGPAARRTVQFTPIA